MVLKSSSGGARKPSMKSLTAPTSGGPDLPSEKMSSKASNMPPYSGMRQSVRLCRGAMWPWSIFKARQSAVHMNIRMTVKGSPAMMDTACSAFSDCVPPACSSATATAPSETARLLPVGRDQVNHQRPAVGRGDEVEHGEDDGEPLEEVPQAVVLVHEVEPVAGVVGVGEQAHRAQVGVRDVGALRRVLARQRRGDVEASPRTRGPVRGRVVEEVVRVVEQQCSLTGEKLRPPVHADGSSPEGAEPDEGVEGGNREAEGDDVGDGAAAGDARQEGADEGCPGDPPAPVEDRPPVHPGRGGALAIVGPPLSARELCEGVRVEADLKEVLHVVAQRLHHQIQQVPGLVQEEDDQQDEVAQDEGRLRQSLDAVVEAGDHGERGEARDDHDGPGFGLDETVLVQVGVQDFQPLQPHDDLLRAQTQRGAEAEDDRHDGDDVQHVPEPAPGRLAKERRERRTEGERQPAAVREDPHAHGREGVDHPRLEAPVEERHVDRVLGLLVVVGVAVVVVPIAPAAAQHVPERL
mmetsp:Transcript_69542/g.196114  ORF Transcript_69542/g.196114 Transcript_69542/m.196114 type:complete len:522 (-) Transcript_69542:511-2076(-)